MAQADPRDTRIIELERRLAERERELAALTATIEELETDATTHHDILEQLQSLADNLPVVVTRVDRELRFVFVNAAVEAATGLRPQQTLGKTNVELGMPAPMCELWNSNTRAVFEQRQPRSVEFAFDAPSGLRHYASRLVPELGPDGEVEHVLGVTHDVTALKQAQQALEDADRHKDEFLAALAHELRNPLAPIRNGLEILRRRGAADELAAKVQEMMERQLSHLVRLVDDLLDVARISRGLVELKPERIEVRTILEHAVETARPLIEAGGHALTVRALDRPVWVDGDLTRLAQVIGNLLNNAAKYTPSNGHIELRVAVEDREAVIRVVDDGIGIATEVLPRVFDLFVQADRSVDRAQGGLGIGLSLARTLVKLHRGTIVAESSGLGSGCTFTVRLPLAPATADAMDGLPPGDPAHPVRRRALVVDDNVDGAETLAMLLELLGHETTTVHSGPAALEAARAWQPEVVLLDIGMPEMDGYEVARRLRRDPACSGMVLVALTGWGSDDDKRKSKDAGFDEHLVKPTDLEALSDVLGRLRRSVPPLEPR